MMSRSCAISFDSDFMIRENKFRLNTNTFNLHTQIHTLSSPLKHFLSIFIIYTMVKMYGVILIREGLKFTKIVKIKNITYVKLYILKFIEIAG